MYDYETEKPKLLTDDGQRLLFAVRDNVQKLLMPSGAVRATEAWGTVSGDSWLLLACLDRLVELGEIREVTSSRVAGQDRVFVAKFRKEND
jgi:hypothetical protein